MKISKLIIFSALLSITSVNAQVTVKTNHLNSTENTSVQFKMSAPQILSGMVESEKGTLEVKVKGLSSMDRVGFPKLPFYSMIIAGNKKDIDVSMDLKNADAIDVQKLLPCPPEKMRCAGKSTVKFKNEMNLYSKNQRYFSIESLGVFRGVSLQKIIFTPHYYDSALGKIDLYKNAVFNIKLKNNATIEINKLYKNIKRISENSYDYLVVSPTGWSDALSDWMEFKSKNQGIKFKLIELSSAQMSSDKMKEIIQTEYKTNKFIYALLIGNQSVLPNFFLKTTSENKTPTDLPYFAMDGANDFIPDVFSGRVVAKSKEEVKNQLKKWMDYEQKDILPGFKHGIGVASSEGSNPSDEEYVRSIEKAITEKFSTPFTHFSEKNPNSNPTDFNKAMNEGSHWNVYLGHGDGTSWPSFGTTYSAKDIKNMNNAKSFKPIWIDVACQNGKLIPGAAGERLSNEVDAAGMPIGSTAFFGGTVNISWHPPAILARGITFKMVEEKNPTLGASIQLGQLYLSQNITNVEEIHSNQIWYHLQGDPSLKIKLK